MKGDPWITCKGEYCNRVLWVQDGPVCEDCLKIRAEKEQQAKEPKFPKKEPEDGGKG